MSAEAGRGLSRSEASTHAPDVSALPDAAPGRVATPEDDLPPPPEPWEIAWANGGEVECCASGRCEVCAPGFGGWS